MRQIGVRNAAHRKAGAQNVSKYDDPKVVLGIAMTHARRYHTCESFVGLFAHVIADEPRLREVVREWSHQKERQAFVDSFEDVLYASRSLPKTPR